MRALAWTSVGVGTSSFRGTQINADKTEGEEGRNQAQARSGDLIGQTELVANTPTPAGDLPSDYLGVLEELKASIRSARLRAMRSVNTELISLYWTIGRTILDRQDVQAWGAGVIGRLADDLRREFPEMRGLSRSNLYYMRQMATAWSSEAIVQQAVGRLPWGHLVLLLGQLDDQPTRDWYARQAVEHGWSRAILLNQIKAKLHLRVGAAENNFSEVMAPEDSELMAELVKDPYNFEFAGLAGSLSEHALEVSLVANVERLLLELGKGFTFYGRQVRLEIDGDEFFIDLLFYNVFLHRYIVVELKIDKFKPEYAGQLNFYVQAIDGELATDRDDPTIGILICADRSASVVRYAVKGMASPIAVARYELGGAASPAVLDALPSEEALLEVAEAVDREADGEDDHPRDLEA